MLFVAGAPPVLAFAPCHERIIDRSTVPLLPAPSDYQFYYRIEDTGGLWRDNRFVVYLPPNIALPFITARNGFRSFQGLEPEDWSQLLPLTRHTDIYQPLLNISGRPKERMIFLIADLIESGDVAIWSQRDGYIESVVIERYEEGCEAGRIFRDSDGTAFLEVIDRIA